MNGRIQNCSMSFGNLSGTQLAATASLLQQPAEAYGNDTNIETHWAIAAFHHAETYFKLISAVDPTVLKLTKVDDDLYKQFREDFKDFQVAKLNEDELKSEDSKAKWREYCNAFQGKVEDWNMGTLLRLNCEEEISEDNTTLVPRVQFLAIEIARNREGFNSGLRNKKPKMESADGQEAQS